MTDKAQPTKAQLEDADTLSLLFAKGPPYTDKELDLIIEEQRSYIEGYQNLGGKFRASGDAAELEAIANAQEEEQC